MAVLNKIRQRSLFLILIIALALFSFVLSDIIKNGGFSAQNPQTVGIVNGEEITQQDFALGVENETRRLGPQTTTLRAVNSVWEREVNRIVLEEQFEELGITVERDKLNQLLKETLQNNPNFQDASGFYSEVKMQEYVANLKATNEAAYQQWVDFENQLARSEQERIYYNLIKAATTSTLSEGEAAYKLENNVRDIQYVQVPYTTIPDEEIEVTKGDIQAYLKDHQKEFTTDATRSIRYVSFAEDPSLEDENATREEIKTLIADRAEYNASAKISDTVPGLTTTADVSAFVNEYSDQPHDDRLFFKSELAQDIREGLFATPTGEVFGPYKQNGFYKISLVQERKMVPDSIKASHILIPYIGLANAGSTTLTKGQAKAKADSIAEVVRRDGSQFADLAAEFSADGSNRDQGGDLGWFRKNIMVKPFNDFVSEGAVGEIGVVETRFGYHVIRIEDQKAKKEAIKVATVAKEILPSDETINEVFNKTTKFEIAATEGDFVEVAKENNYTVRPVNRMKELEENIPGLGPQRSIVQWAFGEEAKVGDIKRFQTAEGYVVAQLTAKTDKGLMSVEDASVALMPLLKNKKKAELIKAKANGSTLDAIASSVDQSVKTAGAINMKNPTISGAGTEPRVVGRAFGLEEGQVSEPIQGDRGVYWVKVTRIADAPALENYASFAGQLTAADRAGVNTQVLQALKEAAEIEDNRSTFY
ncbi:peptidylprolyl isomerase [Croceiramulus getboli]|nr:peptidylprolyl isomerase [Flavobacteriaceae bacterium YJPT1-3]